MKVDALIIGSGVAGLCAALSAQGEVLVVSEMGPTEVLSSMAQGGISAAISPEDSAQQHAIDTFKAGGEIASYDRIERFCQEAPEAIAWLEQLGAPFVRRAEGALAVRQMAGHTHPRTLYAADYTGLRLVQTLYDQALKAGVRFLSHHTLYSLSHHQGAIGGAVLLDRFAQRPVSIAADRVILATGGYGGIFTPHATTGAFGSGRAIALAAEAGAVLDGLHLMQFHPTALLSGQLLSEALRGYGAQLIDEQGERFSDEQLPRDQLSRAIVRHREAGHHTFLDLRTIDAAILEEHLAQELLLARCYAGVDPRTEPVAIAPAAHYSMGGIQTDERGRTAVEGLLACGECVQSGIHGANRLGGNSLLEAVIAGRRAGAESGYCGVAHDASLEPAQIALSRWAQGEPIALGQWRRSLGSVLFHQAGVIRSQARLQSAQAALGPLKAALKAAAPSVGPYLRSVSAYLDAQAALVLAEGVIEAAIKAPPVGAHYKEES